MMFEAYAENDYHDIDKRYGAWYEWEGSRTPPQTWDFS